jgi:hypothetical protein
LKSKLVDMTFSKVSFIVVASHLYLTPSVIGYIEIDVQLEQFLVVFDKIFEFFEQVLFCVEQFK